MEICLFTVNARKVHTKEKLFNQKYASAATDLGPMIGLAYILLPASS